MIGTYLIASLFMFTGQGDTTLYYMYEKQATDSFRYEVNFRYPNLFKELKFRKKDGDLTDVARENNIDWDIPGNLAKLLMLKYNPDPEAEVPGFRVQVYAGEDLKEVDDVFSKFVVLFPEVKIYRIWSKPTFKLRVGNFYDEKKARIYAERIWPDFPGAFVVPDKVLRPK